MACTSYLALTIYWAVNLYPPTTQAYGSPIKRKHITQAHYIHKSINHIPHSGQTNHHFLFLNITPIAFPPYFKEYDRFIFINFLSYIYKPNSSYFSSTPVSLHQYVRQTVFLRSFHVLDMNIFG
jgi:hypothetical protein